MDEDQETGCDYTDLNSLEDELCELYGYYEISSLCRNKEAFNSCMEHGRHQSCRIWTQLSEAEKEIFVQDQVDRFEISSEHERLNAVLTLTYIIQGCWEETETLEHEILEIQSHSRLLLKCDAFMRVWELFKSTNLKGQIPSTLDTKATILESCLNILCTITTVVLLHKKSVQDINISQFEESSEMYHGLCEVGSDLLVELLQTISYITKNFARCFLLKKLLLLARNILLITAGGFEELQQIKETCRKKAGLKSYTEDTISKAKELDPGRNFSRWGDIKEEQKLLSWVEFAEFVRLEESESSRGNKVRTLPWIPKSSIQCLQACLGLNTSSEDEETQSLQVPCFSRHLTERIAVIVKHLYVPLSEFHARQEELVAKLPMTFAKYEEPFVEKTEALFVGLLPIMEPSIRCLVKILAAATPQTCVFRNSFVPEVSDTKSMVRAQVGEDSKRQAEIVVKTASLILILLLKHTKLNHIYQFECIASEIVAASFIPTALRYFNCDVTKYINYHPKPVSENFNCPFKIMNCETSRLFNDYVNANDESIQNSRRNLHASINLLRIMNKITKGKTSRIQMLRMFKAQYCLKRALAVQDPVFQQYALKLLKMLSEYLGKEWRRGNRRILSAIFYNVRHRFLDNWTGGNTTGVTKAWPWEYFEDEKRVHQLVLSYLNRKYMVSTTGVEESNDAKKDGSNVLNSQSFQPTYEEWLHREVFAQNTDWDQFLSCDDSIFL